MTLQTATTRCLTRSLLTAFTPLVACAALLVQASEHAQVVKPWPGETWTQSTPEQEGLRPAPLREFVANIRKGDYGLIDQLLVIRHGRIVVDERFEQDYAAIAAALTPDQYIGINKTDPIYDYDNPDVHPYYQNTNLHSLQSVTKSVTSIAIGIAIDEGYIKGVNVPAMSFFSKYKTQSDPRAQAMMLEDLLTMRSGIQWNLDDGYGDASNSTAVLEASDTWIQYVLDQPMDADPGMVFEYNDGVSVLIGKILREATGRRADDYAREKLFEPLGIENFFWKTTPDGEADTEGGLFLSTHDLARVAYLFLREGEWKGRQIVSADWVRQSTRPHVPDTADGREGFGYGYQWWVTQHRAGEPVIYQGIGYGGQRPIVVPEHDVVVVFNAWDIRGDHAKRAQQDFLSKVLPAAL
ncbi:MAG: serine hydrolase, partial [Pseudomonadota bacterium]